MLIDDFDRSLTHLLFLFFVSFGKISHNLLIASLVLAIVTILLLEIGDHFALHILGHDKEIDILHLRGRIDDHIDERRHAAAESSPDIFARGLTLGQLLRGQLLRTIFKILQSCFKLVNFPAELLNEHLCLFYGQVGVVERSFCRGLQNLVWNVLGFGFLLLNDQSAFLRLVKGRNEREKGSLFQTRHSQFKLDI